MFKRSSRMFLAASIAGSLWLGACADQAVERSPADRNGPAGVPSDQDRVPGATSERPGMPSRTGVPGDPNRDGAPGADGRDATDAVPAPDNTKNNQNDAQKTPFDQAENQTDIRITADIRKAVLAADGLSTNADNAKIVTAGGVVTLSGVVETQAEKDQLDEIARGIAGVTRVDNRLEVATH
ncbi:MAG: BON domain-containing protein [Myxococcota bacterium]